MDLPPIKTPTLPELKGKWKAATKRAWEMWRQDPATTQYTSAEVAFALDTIRLYDADFFRNAGEVRRRMDTLGLTPKGKRDLRYRVAQSAEVIKLPDRPERKLRAVDSG